MSARRGIAGGAAVLGLVALAAGSGSEAPGGGGGGNENVVAIVITEAGCQPAELTIPSGETTFNVRNDGADEVTEFEVLDGDKMLGEAENLAPGLSGSFSIALKEGEYELYCPGGTTSERGTLTVTGG